MKSLHRIWDTQEQKWVKFDSYSSLGIGYNGTLFNVGRADGYDDKGRYIIQRATGLKDKSGAMVYEGDYIDFRVFVDYTWDPPFWRQEEAAEVFYNNMMAMFRFLPVVSKENNDGGYSMENAIDEKSIKIVGNICEGLIRA